MPSSAGSQSRSSSCHSVLESRGAEPQSWYSVNGESERTIGRGMIQALPIFGTEGRQAEATLMREEILDPFEKGFDALRLDAPRSGAENYDTKIQVALTYLARFKQGTTGYPKPAFNHHSSGAVVPLSPGALTYTEEETDCIQKCDQLRGFLKSLPRLDPTESDEKMSQRIDIGILPRNNLDHVVDALSRPPATTQPDEKTTDSTKLPDKSLIGQTLHRVWEGVASWCRDKSEPTLPATSPRSAEGLPDSHCHSGKELDVADNAPKREVETRQEANEAINTHGGWF